MTRPVQFTPAQREAIGLDTLDQDICVVAGPGSGKTTVLIERFRGLVDSGVSPLRIVAITFTEKASHQIRERLAGAFAGRPDLVLEIQRAYVSTVHGFCTRLLRENAIVAGVDPRFRVFNEQEAFALQQRSVTDALDLFLDEDPEPVRNLLRSLRSPDLGDSILEIYDTMRAAGVRLDDLRASQPRMGARAALDRIALDCRGIERLADPGAHLGSRRGQPIELADFQILAEFDLNLNKIPKIERPAIRRIRDELIPAIAPLMFAEYYADQRGTFLEALARFDALYRSRKAAQSALDFSDLEEFSVRLLEENDATRERVRRQFDHLLMDEFQDTNGLQSKLLDLLRPSGRFYAVGDINQAIYGFRHADPRVFHEYRTRIEAEGRRAAELRENWRSRADILSSVLTLVGGRAGVEPHTFQPTRKFRRKSTPSVEVIRCLDDSEARWVADRIAELQGTLTLESGSARFGDMAVLLRKADSMQAFTAAFDEAGIPYVVTAGKGFYEAREVSDLMNLLRVLANPRDEIGLAAVLRSPLAGFSDETLFRLKQSGGASNASLCDGDLGDFGRDLASWREVRHFVSADRLLMRAMDRSGYESLLGPRERGNIEKFLTVVRELGSRQSLDDMVEELGRLRESDPRAQDSVAEESGDVVRVLTIHAAKGLEFPVVFLPALEAGMSKKVPPALLSPRLGLGVRWRHPVTGHSAKDSLYAEIEAELKTREAAESDRLLYVAMTRAEEHLVLSCSGKKLVNWAAYLESSWGLSLDEPVERDTIVTAPDGSAFAVRVLCADRPPAPSQQLSLPLAPQPPRLIAAAAVSGLHDSTASATSIALFADCPRRYYLARYIGWDAERRRIAPDRDDEESDREPADATEFGRQVHALLAGGAPDGAGAEALALAARFQASALGLRLRRATRIEREFDFMLDVDDVVVSGQIDLWFEESGELVIVDYKTDAIAPEEAPERARAYATQLQLYALAVERVTGRPPDRALLYFLRPDLEAPVDVSAAALHAAMATVAAFRQAQDTLKFPIRPASRCLRCPFFHGICPATYP